MKVTVNPNNSGLVKAGRLQTVVAIVLDRSGSMETCKKETLQGLNNEISAIKQNANGDTRVFVTQFDHEVELLLSNVPASALENVDHYEPRGSTRLFDAVGDTITRIEQAVEDTDRTRYMVSIISDGEENASEDWSSSRLAEKIQQLQDTGRWTFAYIGANVDLSKVQKQTGINVSTLVAYQATPGGTTKAFATRAASMSAYLHADVMSKADYWTDETTKS